MQDIDRNIPKENSFPATDDDFIEGFDSDPGSWGDYPLDNLLIRKENRTIHDALRRIKDGTYILDPDFQRDFIWNRAKQSKLIESVVMRIPLPVFYMAENDDGKKVVVDGLQRLSTFQNFCNGEQLTLNLPDRDDLHKKKFSQLMPKYQNRIEDCNLVFNILDSRTPYRARLDIFERVNAGSPLARQQMRNCLFLGRATRFLREESRTDIFLDATGGSLNKKLMRDRELVNRFCAFQLLGFDEYRGNMDDFLANCLQEMNEMNESQVQELSHVFRRSLSINFKLFGEHAFRKHEPGQTHRNPINASLWDILSTGLAKHDFEFALSRKKAIRRAYFSLLADEAFNDSITLATSGARNVRTRFEKSQEVFEDVLSAHTN